MFNFDNATEVKQANSRVNYDLRYSQKTGRFNLSQSAFDRFDIQNNGFNILRDGNTVALQVVPNDQASLHSGRAGAESKGLSFTSKSIVNILDLNSDTEFTMEKTLHNGQTYAILVADNISVDTESTEADDTEVEAEVSNNVPSGAFSLDH